MSSVLDFIHVWFVFANAHFKNFFTDILISFKNGEATNPCLRTAVFQYSFLNRYLFLFLRSLAVFTEKSKSPGYVWNPTTHQENMMSYLQNLRIQGAGQSTPTQRRDLLCLPCRGIFSLCWCTSNEREHNEGEGFKTMLLF